MSQSTVQKRVVVCSSCKYKWPTASKLFYVTCPRCRYTMKIVKFDRETERQRSLTA